jgi:large repetitive protein
VNFIQNSQNDIAYVWDFGDGTPVSNFPNTTHVYTLAGTYNVTLTVMNSGGCASTFSGSQVVAIDTPNVAFTTDPSYPATLSLPTATVQFNDNSTNAVSWIWEFGDGLISSDLNPAHTYQQEGTYFVTLNVENAFGCIGRILGGPFVVTTPELFIPNVFSPNGDGINDVFLVDYSGSQPFTLELFDRWGVLMYQGNNRTQGWNGNNSAGSPAPDGVFYYHVAIGSKDYTGYVTLMR